MNRPFGLPNWLVYGAVGKVALDGTLVGFSNVSLSGEMMSVTVLPQMWLGSFAGAFGAGHRHSPPVRQQRRREPPRQVLGAGGGGMLATWYFVTSVTNKK